MLNRYDIRSVASTSEGRLVKWRERVAGMCKLVMKSLLGSGGRLRNVHKSHAWMEQLHTMVEGYLFSLISNKLMWGIQMICTEEDQQLERCLLRYRHIDPKV